MGRVSYLLRMEPEAHAAVAKAAGAAGLSMNEWLCQAVDTALAGEGNPSSAAMRKQVLAEVGDTAARLAQGFVLVPGAEAGPDSWSDLMGRRTT